MQYSISAFSTHTVFVLFCYLWCYFVTLLLFVIGLLPLPPLMQMFSLNKYAHAIEESIVDPVEKVYVLRSVNYSFSNLVRIEEKCTYTPDPEAPETRTKFTQEFQVKAYPMGVRSRMESTVLSNLTANSGRGRETLESVVQTIRENVAAASSASAEAAAMGAQAFAVSPAFPASSSFPSSRIGLAAIANPPKSEQ